MTRDQNTPSDHPASSAPAFSSAEDAPPLLTPKALSVIEQLAANRQAMADLERRIMEWAAAIEKREGGGEKEPSN